MARHSALNLHEVKHPKCDKCSRLDRRDYTDDGICNRVTSVADDGPVRCVGGWVQQKLHFLTQYLGIFAQSMPHKWGGHIHYVELCSGPGRCMDRETGTEMDGSALAVLDHHTFQHLESATFLDYNVAVVNALNARIIARGLRTKACAFRADYNDSKGLASILSQRSSVGLSLVFIDPTDCSLPFDSVSAISNVLQKADLIINVATGTDAGRNLPYAILNKDSDVRTKYVRFLGSSVFFERTSTITLAQTGKHQELRQQFRDAYRAELTRLGYMHFAQERVEHYYDLLFASRHHTGLRFWEKAQQTRPDGQMTLF